MPYMGAFYGPGQWSSILSLYGEVDSYFDSLYEWWSLLLTISCTIAAILANGLES